MVGSESVSYCELDRVRERLLALEGLAHEPGDDPGEETFWRVFAEHPLCRAQERGRFDALKVSDFLSRRELHRLDLYGDYLRPCGSEYEIEVSIPSRLEHTKTFLFDSTRRDFAERERTLLNLLQPHLVQLYQHARLRRIATLALLDLHAGQCPEAGHGVLVAGRAGTIDAANENGLRLLDAYFPDATPTRVPQELLEWLNHRRLQMDTSHDPAPAPARLTVPGPSGTLTAQLARCEHTEVILLEEQAPASGEPPLTEREREVLALVEQGKRNAEIAEQLWVVPSTVRKHLENIYRKLEVNTRTAAVARFRQAPATRPGDEREPGPRGNA